MKAKSTGTGKQIFNNYNCELVSSYKMERGI